MESSRVMYNSENSSRFEDREDLGLDPLDEDTIEVVDEAFLTYLDPICETLKAFDKFLDEDREEKVRIFAYGMLEKIRSYVKVLKVNGVTQRLEIESAYYGGDPTLYVNGEKFDYGEQGSEAKGHKSVYEAYEVEILNEEDDYDHSEYKDVGDPYVHYQLILLGQSIAESCDSEENVGYWIQHLNSGKILIS
mgnify:CR=1 FL=1